MSVPAAEKDQRPWDLRLVERISRGSGAAGSDNAARLYLGASHGLLGAIAAAVSGHAFFVMLAVIYPLALAGRYLWARSKRGRAGRSHRGAKQSPFGR